MFVLFVLNAYVQLYFSTKKIQWIYSSESEHALDEVVVFAKAVVVTIVVGAGFFAAGGPPHEHDFGADTQRRHFIADQYKTHSHAHSGHPEHDVNHSHFSSQGFTQLAHHLLHIGTKMSQRTWVKHRTPQRHNFLVLYCSISSGSPWHLAQPSHIPVHPHLIDQSFLCLSHHVWHATETQRTSITDILHKPQTKLKFWTLHIQEKNVSCCLHALKKSLTNL